MPRMMGLHGTHSARRPTRARRSRLAPALAAGALALLVACASNAPPPPPAPIEVLRNTAEDGSVRYTIKRSRSSAEAPAGQDSASPTEGEAPEAEPGPGGEIRGQLEQDREFLRRLISRDPRKGLERSQDPRLREIAERLPRLQAELEALENEPEP